MEVSSCCKCVWRVCHHILIIRKSSQLIVLKTWHIFLGVCVLQLGLVIRSIVTAHVPAQAFILVSLGSLLVLMVGWRVAYVYIFADGGKSVEKRRSNRQGGAFEFLEVKSPFLYLFLNMHIHRSVVRVYCTLVNVIIVLELPSNSTWCLVRSSLFCIQQSFGGMLGDSVEFWMKNILCWFNRESNLFWHAKRCENKFDPQWTRLGLIFIQKEHYLWAYTTSGNKLLILDVQQPMENFKRPSSTRKVPLR